MKNELTVEQSAKLIERGISKEKASAIKEWSDDVSQWTHRGDPIFTLADLLGLLPKGICCEGLWIKLRITSWIDEPWFAGYENQVGAYVTPNKAPFSNDELIDALYELVLWCIDNRYINPIEL